MIEPNFNKNHFNLFNITESEREKIKIKNPTKS